MKLRINTHLFASAVFSIVTATIFFIFSQLFNEITIFYLGIPFALSLFFFSLAVLRRDSWQWSSKIAHAQIIERLFYALTISSIIIVLFVPAYEGSVLEWMRISTLNWLRYLSSLLLTSFLPGYFLLKILDRKHAIATSIVIVLSYLLSFFMTFLTAFFILLSANSLGSLALPMIIATNIFLSIAYYLTNRKKARNYLATVNWLELGLISSLLAVIALGSVITMINNAPLTPGDMRDHYGTALDFIKGFPVYGGRMVTYSGGYVFAVYLDGLFVLSGIPPALAEQGLYILSFMPLLAFYSCIKVWFGEKLAESRDKRLPLIGTSLSILLGFGGLYALYLKFTDPAHNDIIQLLGTATSKTYDIYMRILYLPDIVAPLWNIGLPVFFTLLYFLKKDSSNLIRATIIPILVALGYMGHTSEVIIFIIPAFIYTMFFRESNDAKIGPYLVLGLVIVALVDLVAPAQVFISSGVGTGLSLPFVISLILGALTSVAEEVKDRSTLLFSKHLRASLLETLRKSWQYGRWVLVYVYVFFFISWLTIESNFDLWTWGGYSFTPFFVFPSRFGAVGLLVIISIFMYFSGIMRDRQLFFFLSLIPVGFALEQLANYYLPYYPAYRYGTLAFVGACIIAGYGIIRIIDKVQRSPKLKAIVSVLLGFLMISGMLTTALFYVNASHYPTNSKISQDELDASDYIRQNIMSNVSVLSFTTESANQLRNFAGLNAVQDAQRWSKLLLSTSNPYIITYVLSSSNIKYIYVAQRDVELLNSSILNSFVKYFPQVFKNDYATIYEVSPLTAPSSQASSGVFAFSPSLQSPENTTWIDDSFTEGWNPYRQYGEVKNCVSEVSNGTMNISVTSNQSGNVWASYALSGLSLNTTIYPTLSFRYQVENNLTWFTFQLWNSTNEVFLYVGHLTDPDFATKALTLPENQTVTKIELITETVKDAPADTTARAYIDYIKFSAPTSTWSDDNFLKDWEFYKTYGNVSGMNAYSNGDTLKIDVTSNQSGDVWASYSLPLALRTKDSVLSFRYKVDNDYTWFTIILQNASDRFFFYKGHLTDKAWTTKSYFLPDGQDLTRVEIIAETTDNAPPQTLAVVQIDSIEISQQPFSEDDVLPSLFVSLLHSKYAVQYVDNVLMEKIDTYLPDYTNILLTSDPPIPVESLLKWVSAGNSLTVINARGNGFLADLFGINSSSPLLSINNFNSGKVLYINSFPTVTAGKESEILQPEFLKQVREILNVEEYAQSVDVLPVYNSISGSVSIQGDVKVDTDILMLQGAIDLTSSPFSVNESTVTKIYGKINLTIKNATLVISPSESYVIIKPESYPVEGEVLVNSSKETLIVADANVVYNSDMPVSFKFKTTAALSLNVRLPSINASGTIIFDQLDVHSALYAPLGGIVQQPAEIQGSVKFDTMYISNPITIFSMFHAEGRVLNLAETAVSLRPTIPWIEVLTSPYNIAFNAVFLLCIAVYIVKKRNARAPQKYPLMLQSEKTYL
jgi:hypothetical protein